MSYQKKHRRNEMKTTVFSLLFCVLRTHCAIYRTQDEKLSRVLRSSDFKKSASGDSSIVFQTQNWSGVARGADGAQGVFSGAAAAAGSASPAADEAFSIAASRAAPVTDKLEERFGGSDRYVHFNPQNFYNPYIPDHHGSGRCAHGYDFHRDFNGNLRGGYNYGQYSGANRQVFSKSEASSNDASGYGEEPQKDFVGKRQQNIEAGSKSQAFSESMGGFGDTKQNSGQFPSNTFGNSQVNNFPIKNDQTSGGYGSGLYTNQDQQNKASNDILQTTAESKSIAQSESLNGGSQQAKSFNNGLSDFKDLEKNSGQQVEAYGKGFGNSQNLQNGGGQQVGSFGKGFSNGQGFENAGHKVIKQDNRKDFESDQHQKASYAIDLNSDNSYGSRLSKDIELGSGSTNGNAESNYNRQDISRNSKSRTTETGFTGYGQKYGYGRGFDSSDYQTGFQSKGLQVSSQSSENDKSLINNGNSNGQEKLSSSSGSSGNQDFQSTLSGALDLASQSLQASQNQPCSTCQKGGYAFSNAKSHSGSAIALSIGG